MTQTLRAGIIGLSWIATDPAGRASSPALGTAPPYSHASALAAEGAIEVVAACDLREDARQQYTERWGDRWPDTRLYSDGLELLSKEDLDLVCVVTPDHLHAEYVLGAVDAGALMIFCEKPLATSVDDADEIIRRARSAGVTVAVNHTQRWKSEHAAAVGLVRGGDLGPVSQVIITAGGPRAMLFRNLSHTLDLASYLLDDDPAWVIAELEEGHEDYGLVYAGDGGRDPGFDPGANVMIGFNGGTRAYIAGMKAGSPDRSIDLLFESGRVAIDTLGARVIRMPRTNDGTPGSVVGPTVSPLGGVGTVSGMQAAVRELVEAHRTGSQPTSSAFTAHRTVALLDAILRSQAEGSARVEVRELPA